MKISRRGATADHGESSIELREPAFAWSKTDSCITAKQSSVKDFSTKSRHRYIVRLSITEINEVLRTLSDAAVDDPECFEKLLEPSLKAILRIQAVASGIKT